MRLPVFGCLALACSVAVAVLAACAGSETTAPLPGRSDVLGRIASRSWAAPEAKKGALLYVSDVQSNDVNMYSYPQGKLVGTLSGFGSPRGECVDAAGDVWIADAGGDDAIEFPHGSSQPVYALNTSGAPVGCSVNPVNGNLAVSGGVNGIIVSVFRPTKHGWSAPVRYGNAALVSAAFCGYDSAGNLVVDGLNAQGGAAFAELRAPAHRLVRLKVAQQFKAPGQIQWDGSALAIEDAGVSPSVVYQFSVGAGGLTKIGSTTLDGSKSVHQSWIEGSTLIGPDPKSDRIGFWNYPAGGQPATTIANVRAYGAVVSPAQ